MVENRRVIVRKNEIVEIPADAVGVPVAEAFGPKVKLPPSLAGALVYEIDGRRIIARQESGGV